MMDAWNTSNSFWYIVIPIFLLVVLFLGIYIFKSNKIHSNAIEVLKVRYAKGEISKEEFEQMKRDIVS
ncbi:MAG: SHOCT domain-containing protein [Candidatus Cloacimonetes bacterium]|nr:SHOCT domain-containing protein [Candidatus Cloacimonadota bacterium]MCF7815135.1 SHOCT domain-containing protein [Candidatus Cloacimonadota bacterium]MCF7869161.1 SHOCT domain-containing protein [Candidatus Cloacimonadota bacterium]MCF7884603.1 SHOCT domain-containing protein [Candidatus Cloacimonadota bacterium]